MSRQTRIGGLLWVSVIQYFVLLLVVRSAWTLPYDPLTYAISDLGAATCGEFAGRQVCSPWHALAQASWVLAGATLATGAVLTRHVFGSRSGTGLLVLSGLGEIGVGLFPEDVSAWHVPCALMAVGCGLLGVLLLGRGVRERPGLRALGWAGVATGTVGLAALVVTVAFPRHLFGLVERIGVYPILLWFLAAGVTILCLRPARRHNTPGDTPYGKPHAEHSGRYPGRRRSHRPGGRADRADPHGRPLDRAR
ncbi:DUF998 domain-containing protein [Cellulomonas sp. NPDC089187]|uniref:DUF998 domain-containing protein n=1 Tax=Cellulomonas sp. NPDC089187 TaxID=3154970 RepID=UPI0034220643